jgi:hypothetical protein
MLLPVHFTPFAAVCRSNDSSDASLEICISFNVTASARWIVVRAYRNTRQYSTESQPTTAQPSRLPEQSPRVSELYER